MLIMSAKLRSNEEDWRAYDQEKKRLTNGLRNLKFTWRIIRKWSVENLIHTGHIENKKSKGETMSNLLYIFPFGWIGNGKTRKWSTMSW